MISKKLESIISEIVHGDKFLEYFKENTVGKEKKKVDKLIGFSDLIKKYKKDEGYNLTLRVYHNDNPHIQIGFLLGGYFGIYLTNKREILICDPYMDRKCDYHWINSKNKNIIKHMGNVIEDLS